MRTALAILIVSCFPALARAESWSPLVDQARKEGLPAALLQNKAREGLAKGVAPQRIERVVAQLLHHLRRSRTLLLRTFPPRKGQGASAALATPLWAALAEAGLAGVGERAVVVAMGGQRIAAQQRVDALVELHGRGYPQLPAAQLVHALKPSELGRVGSVADTLKRRSGLSRAEVLDGLRRAVVRHGGLHSAAGAVSREARRGGGKGNGPGGAGSGGYGKGP